MIALPFVAYASFTVVFTARRVPHQRRVNQLDSYAKSHLADSLINYDTIKYFNSEQGEARRFADIMTYWANAGMANQRALFTLHVGQAPSSPPLSAPSCCWQATRSGAAP